MRKSPHRARSALRPSTATTKRTRAGAAGARRNESGGRSKRIRDKRGSHTQESRRCTRHHFASLQLGVADDGPFDAHGKSFPRRAQQCPTTRQTPARLPEVCQTNEELTTLPIGLCGSGPTSPVVVRIAALRDNDIAAVVCRSGLIDLAGTLYLHSLAAPILMLVGANDEHLVASNRRALKEASCHKEMKLILGCGSDFATTSYGTRDNPVVFTAITAIGENRSQSCCLARRAAHLSE
jgi:hypothetical protein